MLKKYYGVFGPALRVIDAVILISTWIMAYYLRQHYPLAVMRNAIPPFENYLGHTVLILLLWGTVFNISKLYSSKRMVRRTEEVFQVLKAHAVCLLIFITLTYLFSTFRLSRGVFLYFGFLSAVLIIGFRLLLRNFLRKIRTRGLNLQKIIIVGTSSGAHEVYHKLNRHPELGFEMVGFIGKATATAPRGVPILGDFSQVAEIVRKHDIQKLIIAPSHQEYSELDGVFKSIKDEVIDIVLIPDIHEYLVIGCEVEEFDGIPLVAINESPMTGFNMFLKRIMDVFLSFIALVILAPVMIVLSFLVKLTSKGPVFYKQDRMSLNGRHFNMLKFRSMSVDQTGDVELLTKKNDPRVTSIGSFMRRTSLDELPQFFNVFLGHMSLVGPRPERSWVVEELRTKIPSYMLKHKVKAGITGWAQVNGWRGDTSLEKRIECDLYYIRNWSLVFDVKILLMTVIKGFINRNAY